MTTSIHRILTAKDLQTILQVKDIKTAQKYLKDIKEHYKCPLVLYSHFESYFKIPKQTKVNQN